MYCPVWNTERSNLDLWEAEVGPEPLVDGHDRVDPCTLQMLAGIVRLHSRYLKEKEGFC